MFHYPDRDALASSVTPLPRPLSVLIISHDESLKASIVEHFHMHHCHAVGTMGAGALRQLKAGYFNLVLLDAELGLPSGLNILHQLRIESDIPVILVTGSNLGDIDCIVGLELGADDFVVGPVNPRALLARARAILRREEIGRCTTERTGRGGYRFNGWELRRRDRVLTDPQGKIVELTKGEYALLTAFLDAPRRTLSRLQLMQATRQHEDIYDRSIDVQVLRLRRKLAAEPGSPNLIRTQRGIGYQFDVAVEPFF